MSSDTGPATVFSRDESTNFRYALQPGKCIRGQTNPPATISYPRGVDEMDGTRCGTWTRSTSVLIAENHGISARTCPGIDMVSTTERAGPLPHRPGQEAGPRASRMESHPRCGSVLVAKIFFVCHRRTTGRGKNWGLRQRQRQHQVNEVTAESFHHALLSSS